MFTNGTRYTFKSKAFEKISLQSLVASNTTTSSVQNQSLANFYNRYSLLNSNEIEPKLTNLHQTTSTEKRKSTKSSR